MKTHGSCSCGDVTFEVDGEPLAQLYCHCRSCQTAHAAPLVAAALFPASSVSYRGEVKRVRVTQREDAPHRLTCPSCGTKVLNEPFPTVRCVLVPLCATRDWFKPTMHVEWRDRLVEVADGLPRYRDYPKELGGTGELA